MKNYIRLACLFLLFLANFAYAGVYLDNLSDCPTCKDGATTYDPVRRSVGSGSDTVYTSLPSFNANIVARDTNYIRSGSYYYNAGNWARGALTVSKSGSSSSYTVVKAFPGEEREVIIYTAAGKDRINPDNSRTLF